MKGRRDAERYPHTCSLSLSLSLAHWGRIKDVVNSELRVADKRNKQAASSLIALVYLTRLNSTAECGAKGEDAGVFPEANPVKPSGVFVRVICSDQRCARRV